MRPREYDTTETLASSAVGVITTMGEYRWDIECTIPVSPTTGPTDAGGDDSGDSSGGDSGGEGGEDGDKACACDASRRPGGDLLLAIGALGLTRRRRLRPPIRQAHPVGDRT